MTADFSLSLRTRLPQGTAEVGRRLGASVATDLQRAMVVCLYGDLAAGKTVFVQGLALGLGVGEEQYVTSPTYTLINTHIGRLPLHHVDLYRLSGPDDFESIGLYELLEETAVVAVEWSERFAQELPPHRLNIEIGINADDSRTIGMTAYGQAAKVLLQRLADALSE
jgi:tRNA threonylcarbamoyladenosine biosynthesis protein TsaE